MKLVNYSSAVLTYVRNYFRKGGFESKLAEALGITPEELHEWRLNHPELDEIIEIGLTSSQAFWEKKGRENLCNPNFNTNEWADVMVTQFGWQR